MNKPFDSTSNYQEHDAQIVIYYKLYYMEFPGSHNHNQTIMQEIIFPLEIANFQGFLVPYL